MALVTMADDPRSPLREAGIALIGERGLYGFSLSDLAARSGRSRALVNHHYRSKEEFLDELVRDLLGSPMAETVPSSEPLEGLLVRLSIEYVRGTLDEPSGRALLSILSMTHPDARHAEAIRNWWKVRVAGVRALLKAGVASGDFREDADTDMTAVPIISAVTGASLAALTTATRHREPLRAAITDLVSRSLNRT